MITRRQIVRTIGSAGIAAALAGCGGEEPTETATTSPTETDSATPTESTVTETAVSESTATESTVVDVGPEGRLRFVPADIEVSVGDTVKWVARSEGHNVTSHPDAAPRCENPEGAEPFTSYEGDAHFAIMEVGEVFTHEFTVPGEYVYVCTPHAGQGMVGTVTVSE